MKKSELIKKLQKSLDEIGDEHLLYVKIMRLTCTEEFQLTTRARKDKNGLDARLSLKEFQEYCKNNPIEQGEG